MDSQVNYLLAQQRQAELVSRAEQARLANDARAAVSAPSRRWNLGRPVATHRLRALLTAITPWEDRPARAPLRRLEFRARASHHGVIELELGPPNAQPGEIYGAMATEEPRPAPRVGPLAEAPGYPPLCVHGMNPLTDRGYDLALGRLRRG